RNPGLGCPGISARDIRNQAEASESVRAQRNEYWEKRLNRSGLSIHLSAFGTPFRTPQVTPNCARGGRIAPRICVGRARISIPVCSQGFGGLNPGLKYLGRATTQANSTSRFDRYALLVFLSRTNKVARRVALYDEPTTRRPSP